MYKIFLSKSGIPVLSSNSNEIKLLDKSKPIARTGVRHIATIITYINILYFTPKHL